MFRVLVIAAALTSALVWVSPALASGAGVECLRAQTPPPSPAGGAVIARPLEAGSSSPNVVVIPPESKWTASGSCAGNQAAAAQVMTHPRSIMVGAGGAVLFQDQGLFSAWGAKDVAFDDPAPVLFPGRSDWTTTEAEVVDPGYLLNVFDSCRACSLARIQFTPIQGLFPEAIAYTGDLDGADLSGATLKRSLSGWSLRATDLSRATLKGVSLAGAVLDHAVVTATNFDGADLSGAQLTALRYRAPPSFAGVKVGSFAGSCTAFKDTDLVPAKLTVANFGRGCDTRPLLPGSSAGLGLISSAAHLRALGVFSFADARFVASAADRDALAGADLDGIKLTGASFTGFPARLVKTKFDDASLADASFDLADLSGASFHNANLTAASFRGADLAAAGDVKGASFAGSKTDLRNADFVGADISGSNFVGADSSGAVFSRALAVDTDFNGVRAENADFNGAHIYGNGQAFDSAADLRGADFDGAVLAGNVDQGGGFNFTHTDLTGAKFDATQCVGCNFTGSRLDQTNFTGAYLPGAILKGVLSLSGAKLLDARLYCGDQSNSSCPSAGAARDRWAWPLVLGSGEVYGPVPFANSDVAQASLSDVAVCPDGKDGPASPAGCAGHLQPDPAHAPPIPARCSAAGSGACPTATSTVFDSAAVGDPLALAAATPPTWASTLTARGLYAGFDDATIRLLGSASPQIVAGRPGTRCPAPTDACGDGGPATQALLGRPAGVAVGLDGSVYVADPALHRVRRIEPSGKITTVAGDGHPCVAADPECGDHGPATDAALEGPYGVWVDPTGQIYIADGTRGIREVLADGTIVPLGAGGLDVRSLVGDLTGNLYAATNHPDYIIKLAAGSGQVTKVVGTGTSGYNGNTTRLGTLAPGTSVQIDLPEGLSLALDGDVIFADSGNYLIRAYVPSSGHVTDALAGALSHGRPDKGFNGDGHWADETQLNHPQAVTVSGDGLFVVADTGNQRVRQFGPSPRRELAEP